MSSQIEPDSNFIEQWLKTRRAESELDQRVLALLDEHRRGSMLDEANLLKGLITLSEESEDNNGSD